MAKGLIALANHGGGVLIVGFDTDGEPAGHRPENLDSYSQDAVNGVVERFADPVFHCPVHRVRREADRLEYPVILVPGGHSVPIRSRRGSPGNEIQADRYYIRRPGPASEMPQGGQEWDELIRRCVRNNSDEIGSLLRGHIGGTCPEGGGIANRHRSVGAVGCGLCCTLDRIGQRGTSGFTCSNAARSLPRCQSSFEGVNLEHARLRDVIRRAEQNLTGLPAWWWARGEGIRPYIRQNTIECHMAEQAGDIALADFWRASTTGELFLIRGYGEDTLEQRGQPVRPGTVFGLTLPIRRTGEYLLFIQRFATEADVEDSTATLRCEWTGLQDRRLSALGGPRWLFNDHRSRSDRFSRTISVPVQRISGALPEIVREPRKPFVRCI